MNARERDLLGGPAIIAHRTGTAAAHPPPPGVATSEADGVGFVHSAFDQAAIATVRSLHPSSESGPYNGDESAEAAPTPRSASVRPPIRCDIGRLLSSATWFVCELCSATDIP